MGCGGACGCQDCYGSDDCKDASKPDVCMAPQGTFASVWPTKPMAARRAAPAIAVPDVATDGSRDVIWAEFGGSSFGVLVPGGTDPAALQRLLVDASWNRGSVVRDGAVVADDAAPSSGPSTGSAGGMTYEAEASNYSLPELPSFGRRGGGGAEPEAEPSFPCDCWCYKPLSDEAFGRFLREHEWQFFVEPEPDLDPDLSELDAEEETKTQVPEDPRALRRVTVARNTSVAASRAPVVDVEAMLASQPEFLTEPRRLLPQPVEAENGVSFDTGLPVGAADLRVEPQITASVPPLSSERVDALRPPAVPLGQTRPGGRRV